MTETRRLLGGESPSQRPPWAAGPGEAECSRRGPCGHLTGALRRHVSALAPAFPPLFLSTLHDLGEHQRLHSRSQPLAHVTCTLSSDIFQSCPRYLAQPRAHAQPQTTDCLGWRGPRHAPEAPPRGAEKIVLESLPSPLTPVTPGNACAKGDWHRVLLAMSIFHQGGEAEGKAPG